MGGSVYKNRASSIILNKKGLTEVLMANERLADAITQLALRDLKKSKFRSVLKSLRAKEYKIPERKRLKVKHLYPDNKLAKVIIEEVFQTIFDTLAARSSFQLDGFGQIYVSEYNDRKYLSNEYLNYKRWGGKPVPESKKYRIVDSEYRMVFKPSRSLRAAVKKDSEELYREVATGEFADSIYNILDGVAATEDD